MLCSRETSSHESSVNGEPGWRVMIWVMQAGRWGFDALFHKHFNSKEWPQAEASSPAGWSSNTLLEWGCLVRERMWDEPGAVSCCPKRKQVGGSKEESSVVTAS